MGRIRGELQGTGPLADPNFDDFRDQNHSSSHLQSTTNAIGSVSGASEPTRTTVAGSHPTYSSLRCSSRSSDGISAPAMPRKGPPGRSRQPWILEAVSRIVSGPFAVHLKIDGAVFSVIGVAPGRVSVPAPTWACGWPADEERIRAGPRTTTMPSGASATE